MALPVSPYPTSPYVAVEQTHDMRFPAQPADSTVSNALHDNKQQVVLEAVSTDLIAAIATYGGGAASIDDVISGLMTATGISAQSRYVSPTYGSLAAAGADGTEQKPFTLISEAIASFPAATTAAEEEAERIIYVMEGTIEEDVTIPAVFARWTIAFLGSSLLGTFGTPRDLLYQWAAATLGGSGQPSLTLAATNAIQGAGFITGDLEFNDAAAGVNAICNLRDIYVWGNVAVNGAVTGTIAMLADSTQVNGTVTLPTMDLQADRCIFTGAYSSAKISTARHSLWSSTISVTAVPGTPSWGPKGYFGCEIVGNFTGIAATALFDNATASLFAGAFAGGAGTGDYIETGGGDLNTAYLAGNTITTAGGNDVEITGSENLHLFDNNFLVMGNAGPTDGTIGYSSALSQMYFASGSAGSRDAMLFSTRLTVRDDAGMLSLVAANPSAVAVHGEAGHATDTIFGIYGQIDNTAGTTRAAGGTASAIAAAPEGKALDSGGDYYAFDARPAVDNGGAGAFTGLHVGTAYDLGIDVESGGIRARDDIPVLLGTSGGGIDYQLGAATAPGASLVLLPIGGAGSEVTFYMGAKLQLNDGSANPYPIDTGEVLFNVKGEAGHATNDANMIECRLDNASGTARSSGQLDALRLNMDGNAGDSNVNAIYVGINIDDFAPQGGTSTAKGLWVKGAYDVGIEVDSGGIQLDAGGLTFAGLANNDLVMGAGCDIDFNGAYVDIDPTESFIVTMDDNKIMRFAIGHNAAGMFVLEDNTGDNYLSIDTTTGSEKMSYGNASNNPTHEFLGSGPLGFFSASPAAQHSSTGQTAGFTAGTGSAVNDDSTFTGGSGATAYTIGDMAKALKAYGLLAL